LETTVIACSEQCVDQGETDGKGRVLKMGAEDGRQDFKERVHMERKTGFEFTTLALAILKRVIS
jgi:hypothetical protein